jgi:hypothetical protein
MACRPRRGLGPSWTTAVRPRARRRAHRSVARRRYDSPAVVARGGGGRGGHGGVGGAGDVAVSGVPSPETERR